MPRRYKMVDKALVRYGFAMTAAWMGLLLRLGLERWTGPGLPTYITFYPMVMFAALVGGFGPGLLATLASALMVDYWVVTPGEMFTYDRLVDGVGVALFVFMGTFTSVVAGLYRRIRSHLVELIKDRTVEFEQANNELQTEVAEHLQAKKILRVSEARLRLAHLAANAGAWEWDLRTNANVWSEELWRVYGLAPHSCQPSFEAWLDTVHPDDRARTAQAVKDSASRGTELAVEWRMRGRDGTERWLMSRGQPARDADGTVIRYFGIVMDITDRRRIEDAMRASEGQLRLAHEATGLEVWDFNPRSGTMQCNARIKAWWGLQPEQPFTYEKWIERLHPDDRDMAVARMRTSMDPAGQDRQDMEYRVLQADGSARWVSVCIQTHFAEAAGQRQAVRIVGTMQDITTRKMVEQALRESRQDLDRAQAVAHTGSWRLDVRRNELSWSEESWQIFGVPKGTPLTYGTFLGTVHPDDRARVNEKWLAALKGEPYDLVHRIVAGDTVKWVRERGELEFDEAGVLRGGFGTTQDITDLWKAQEALRESEEKYRNLFNRMTEGFALHEILCDDKGKPCDCRILDINPAFEHLTGLAREKVVGKTLNEVLPGESSQWIPFFGTVALTGEPRHFETYSPVLKRQYEVFAYRSAPRKFAALFMDVTERRDATNKMEAALREKGVLLQELYHRVKNNMHLIISMLNLQAVKLADPVAARVFKETQDMILSMALVHEKLYKSGNLSQIDLKEYIDDLLKLLLKSYQSENHKVRIATRMESVFASIDSAVPCGLLLSELIINAFKHAFPGGRTGTITVHLRPMDGDSIELLVADDGVGLPDGYDYRTGTTLGLQSVVALVEHQLSGSIVREGTEGTAFRIQFKAPRQKTRI